MNDDSKRGRQDRREVPVGRTSAHVTILDHESDHARIARRAYELYESRHRADGRADEDWFQAASEDAASVHTKPIAVGRYGVSDSFGDRIRRARR